MRYPPEFVDKVQESTNLVEIISQYTQLKPSGRGYMGRCPFPDHQEKTASFSVSEVKQVYHCFGCKKSGNIFSFLRDYNGMNFPEALEYLADRAGVPIPQLSPAQGDQQDKYNQQQDHKKKILKANKVAAEFFREYYRRTSVDHPIRQYVLRRKLKSETIEEFQIGFAPNEWEMLTQHLQKNQVALAVAEDAKLIKQRREGHGYHDLFRDRLMFPILSVSGEVLAFGGRIHDQGEPKYLNSPESPVFHKGKVLYGLAQTAKYIRSEDLVVVVEGYMDLVSLFQAGLKNVAATMGTALTADHARLIKRMTTNVVVMFDGDEAGQMAAERSLPILLAQGLFPRGLVLTEAKDPDEYVLKFGLDALNEKVQNSPDLFKVVLKIWMKDYRPEPSAKVKLVDKIKPIFEAMSDARLRSLYVDDLCQMMGVTKDWLRSSLQNNSVRQPQSGPGMANLQGAARSSVGALASFVAPDQAGAAEVIQPAGDPRHVEIPKMKISDAPKVELMLLQVTLKSRANLEMLLNLSEPLDFKQLLSQIRHLGLKQILENAEQVYRQDHSKFDRLISLLIDQIDKPELLFQVSHLDVAQATEFDEEKERKLLVDLVKRIQQEFIKDQAKRIAQDLKKNPSDGSLSDEKLRQFAELQKSRLSLKK